MVWKKVEGFLRNELIWFGRTAAVKFGILWSLGDAVWKNSGSKMFFIFLIWNDVVWKKRGSKIQFTGFELTWFERTSSVKFRRRAEDRLCGLETYWRNQYAGANCARKARNSPVCHYGWRAVVSEEEISIFFYDNLATRCCKACLVAAIVCWFAVSLCGKV